MSRAIAAISNTALPRFLFRIENQLAAFFAELFREIKDPYRPERHYMRGPGPACAAKAAKAPH